MKNQPMGKPHTVKTAAASNSEIYLKAAEVVATKFPESTPACFAIDRAAGIPDSAARQAYGALFAPVTARLAWAWCWADADLEAMQKLRLVTDCRLTALCFMAAIAADEEATRVCVETPTVLRYDKCAISVAEECEANAELVTALRNAWPTISAHLRSQPAGYVSVPVATVKSLYATWYLCLYEKTGGSWPRDRFETWLDGLMEDAGLVAKAYTEAELREMLSALSALPDAGKEQK